MKLREIKAILEARTIGRFEDLEREYTIGGAADLMSDVLAFVTDECVLLTGLTNEQVVRTAEMVDVGALVFVRGKIPPEPVVKMADERGITLLTTKYAMFVACGKLYAAGLDGFKIDRADEQPADRV